VHIPKDRAYIQFIDHCAVTSSPVGHLPCGQLVASALSCFNASAIVRSIYVAAFSISTENASCVGIR